MDSRNIFDPNVVKKLSEAELVEGRRNLLKELVETTGLPLEALSNRDGLFYFEIRATLQGNGDFQLVWDGHVSYSDSRDDGLWTYGAHLFLYAGTTRLMSRGLAFRYLSCGPNPTGASCWKDYGWQDDEFDEWETRELLPVG